MFIITTQRHDCLFGLSNITFYNNLLDYFWTFLIPYKKIR